MTRIRVEVKVSAPFENDQVREFFIWAAAHDVNEVANRLKLVLQEFNDATPEPDDAA